MRRILSAALAAILLVLSIADIGLWIRGHTTGDTLLYSWSRKPTGFHFLQLWTGGGGLRLMHGEEFPPDQQALLSWNPGFQHGTYSGPTYPYDKSSEGNARHFLGFEFFRLDSSYPHLDRHFKSITLSHAFLILLLMLWPLKFARNFRRRQRRRLRRQRGLCIHCGYDVRGLSERCPECGSPLE